MQITVNGASLDVEEGLSVGTLLARLGKPIDQVAVEHNGELIEQANFDTLTLEAKDRLEVVHFVGGG